MVNRATVVCCYNNRHLYDELVINLENQDETVDAIGIDNTKGQYSSCSKAFNSVVSNVQTKYVIYSHQDIRLKNKECIRQFIDYMEEITENDIMGVAGCGITDRDIVSNITQGVEEKRVGIKRIDKTDEVFSIDECFFGGYTSYFRNNLFDEMICDGFHLYAVEQCLRTRSSGGKVYVCAVGLNHLSGGKKDDKLNDSFFKICKKYHREYGYIYTTYCRGHTAILLREAEYLLRRIKYNIWGK